MRSQDCNQDESSSQMRTSLGRMLARQHLTNTSHSPCKCNKYQEFNEATILAEIQATLDGVSSKELISLPFGV